MSQESLESGRIFYEQLLQIKTIKCPTKNGPNKCVAVCVSDGDAAQDVSDFNWDDYLEETGSLSVPHHAFKHVSSLFQVTTYQSIWPKFDILVTRLPSI